MKAIEQFKMEAVEQFGAGSVISEDSAKQVLKTIGRSGFGLGHLKQSGMLMKSGEYQLPISIESKKVVKTKKVRERKPLDWNQLVATVSSAAMGFGTVYALINRP